MTYTDFWNNGDGDTPLPSGGGGSDALLKQGKGLGTDVLGSAIASNPYTAAAAVISDTVVKVLDAKKRRELEERLGKLSLAQQRELGEKLQRTQSQQERIKIIVNAVAQVRVQQSLEQIKAKSRRNLLLITGGILVLLTTVYLATRK